MQDQRFIELFKSKIWLKMKPLTLHINILAGWDIVTTQKHLGSIQQRLAMLFASPWDWQSWFQCRLWCNVFVLGYFYLQFPFECSTLWGKKHSRMGFSLYTLLENFLWKTEIFTGYYGFNRIYNHPFMNYVWHHSGIQCIQSHHGCIQKSSDYIVLNYIVTSLLSAVEDLLPL